VLFAQSGGPDVYSRPYGDLYNTLFGSTFTLACFFVTVGVTMATLSGNAKKRRLPMALQFAVATAVLLTGARQYALVGPLVLIVIASKAGLKIKPMVLLSGALLTLLVISVVGKARSHGVLTSPPDMNESGLRVALAEMGGTLQTVRLAVGWIESGDQKQWGGGYWLPIERGIGLVIPGLRKDLSTDPRAMSEVMLSRVSGLGGSAVAESFYNFGLGGVSVFVIFGYVLGYLHLMANSPSAAAWEGVILYALILHIRNWFISVPAMIAVGTIPIVIALCVRRRERLCMRQALPFRDGGCHQGRSIATRRPANIS
jgi:hypothetical protein